MKADQLIGYLIDLRGDAPLDVHLERIKQHITENDITDGDILERVRYVEELLARANNKASERMLMGSLLAEVDALILVLPSLMGKSSGGATTAQGRQEEKAERVKEAVRIWRGLSNKQEHERANIIAKRMGKTSAAIRTYLREAGIKTKGR